MNYLDKFLHPQSIEQLQLLKNLFWLSLFVLIPYVGLLSGFTIISSLFYKKGIKTENKDYKGISAWIINNITFNKISVIVFGVIPIISISLILIQFLQNTSTNIIGSVLISLFLFLIGVSLIYSYKHSVNFSNFSFDYLDKDNNDKLSDEIIFEYKNKSTDINDYYPIWGLLFVLSSIYVFFSIIKTTNLLNVNTINNTLINGIFSISNIVYFITFLFFSAVLSLVILNYLINSIKEKLNDSIFADLKKTIVASSIFSEIGLLIMLLINLVSSPVNTLSENYFFLFVLSVATILIILTLSYLALKNSVEYKNSVMFLTLLLTILFVSGTISKFSTSTQLEVDKITTKYISYQEETIKQLNSDTLKVSTTKAPNTK